MNKLFVLFLLVTHFSPKACEETTGNTLYLALYDENRSATYIGWLSANPEPYKNNMTLSYRTSYVSTGHHWTSVAADYHGRNITFHDTRNHWVYLSDDFEDPEGQATPVAGGTSGRVDALTIDWLAKNVYWVDEGYNWIKMTNYTGGGEALIIDTGLERPSGIACHPSKGYLFWTDLGNIYLPKIERSFLSGANRTTIVTGLSEPRSIAVDANANRIYWIDNTPTESKIESSDLNGNGRRTEVSQLPTIGTFDSISVDGDYIFVSVVTELGIFIRYYNKDNANELVFEFNFGTLIKVLDVCVTGPNVQPMPTTLPCHADSCDHYCVSAADEKYECVCRDNYQLSPNGTCIELPLFNPPFCIIGRPDLISRFEPRLVHYNLENKPRFVDDILTGDRLVTSVAVDIRSNLLFYVDDLRKSIFVVRMEGGQQPIVIRSNIGRVDGLAVDWISLNIYWVDYDKQQLMFSTYEGMIPIVLFNDVVYPRAIAVDPNARLLFWTEQTLPAKLVGCNLEGTNRHELLNTNLQNPSGITLDHVQSRIYIVDEGSTSIYVVNYDGTGHSVLGVSLVPATDVTIFQDFLLLAETYFGVVGIVEAIHKTSGEHEGLLTLNSSVLAIDIGDESTQPLMQGNIETTLTTTSSWITTKPTTDACSLPLDSGVCSVTPVLRYYYNSATTTCQPFAFNCEGNANNFVSSEDCQTSCISIAVHTTTTAATTTAAVATTTAAVATTTAAVATPTTIIFDDAIPTTTTIYRSSVATGEKSMLTSNRPIKTTAALQASDNELTLIIAGASGAAVIICILIIIIIALFISSKGSIITGPQVPLTADEYPPQQYVKGNHAYDSVVFQPDKTYASSIATGHQAGSAQKVASKPVHDELNTPFNNQPFYSKFEHREPDVRNLKNLFAKPLDIRPELPKRPEYLELTPGPKSNVSNNAFVY